MEEGTERDGRRVDRARRAGRHRRGWVRALTGGFGVAVLAAGVGLARSREPGPADLAGVGGSAPAGDAIAPGAPAGAADARPPFAVPDGFKVASRPSGQADGGTESWLVYHPDERVPSAIGPSITVTVVEGPGVTDVRRRLRDGSRDEQIAAAKETATGDYDTRTVGNRRVATARRHARQQHPAAPVSRDVDLHVLGGQSSSTVVKVIAEGVDQATVDSVIRTLER